MRYPRDPYWLQARFPSTCSKCDGSIRKTERIFFYPVSKTALCFACGDDAARDFEAMRQDEAFYNA